jgi:hypothetical protein
VICRVQGSPARQRSDLVQRKHDAASDVFAIGCKGPLMVLDPKVRPSDPAVDCTVLVSETFLHRGRSLQAFTCYSTSQAHRT